MYFFLLFFNRIPFYGDLKMIAFVYLSWFRGSEKIYLNYIEPFYKKNQENIEKNIDKYLNIIQKKFDELYQKLTKKTKEVTQKAAAAVFYYFKL